MGESSKDVLRKELKKLLPELEQMNEVLEKMDRKVVDNHKKYEVKEVNKRDLEAIKRSALGKDGRFEKIESNESRKNNEVLNEIRDQVAGLDKKVDEIIHYLKSKKRRK